VRWVVAAAAPLVLILIVMSWYQAATWRHSIALWEHALASGAGQALQTRGNYARALAELNMPAEQEEQLRAAVQIAPLSAKASMNYGVFLANHGQPERALPYYRRALQIAPHYALARMNLGILLAWSEPIDQIRAALDEPSVWPARPSPSQAEAADHLRTALRLQPDLDQARLHLGALCVRTGRLDQARALLRQASRARPLDPDPHAWLALAALRDFRPDEAAAELAEAARLLPGLATAAKPIVERLLSSGNPGSERDPAFATVASRP
jgi:tetratricopeptide (TPR) repeat protein